MARSHAAKVLWHDLGRSLRTAAEYGASWEEILASLGDRAAELEKLRMSGAEPRDIVRQMGARG